jgi:predicted RNA-binding Zn-ribbon protein involved in translation (DUF1610 family)
VTVHPFGCPGCLSSGPCRRDCPEAVAFAQAEVQVLAEAAAARATCTADGHVGVWQRCDHHSQGREYTCDRCGTPLDEPQPSEPAGGAS